MNQFMYLLFENGKKKVFSLFPFYSNSNRKVQEFVVRLIKNLLRDKLFIYYNSSWKEK